MKILATVLFLFIFCNCMFSQNTSVIRRFTEEKNKLKVELTIYNTNKNSGFAKLTEDIPKGYLAEFGKTKDKNVNFSFMRGQVKFIWSTIQNTDSTKVSYYVYSRIKSNFDDFISGVKGSFRTLNENSSSNTVLVTNQSRATKEKPAIKLVPTNNSKTD